MKSKIFTKAELEAMKQREQGNRLDPTGIFSSRIKPKIKELLEVWFPQKNKLKKSIETKK